MGEKEEGRRIHRQYMVHPVIPVSMGMAAAGRPSGQEKNIR